MENGTTKPNPKPRIAYAERRVKPLARLLRCATALRVTAAPRLRLKASGMAERLPFGPSTARSLTTRTIHPLSPHKQPSFGSARTR